MSAANHSMAWAAHGGCRGEDPDLFFPVTSTRGDIAERDMNRVRPICQGCPVFAECHAWAIEHETEGIWAATTPAGRRRLRKSMGLPDLSKTVDARSPDVVVGLVPDVAELTDDGRSAAEIASILGITQRTVVRHRTARKRTA